MRLEEVKKERHKQYSTILKENKFAVNGNK